MNKKLSDLLREATFGVNKQTLEDKLIPSAIEEIADSLIANGVTVQKWIPVADKLPELSKEVLVFRNGEISCDFLCSYDRHFYFYHDVQEKMATHWMPLPEQPKENKVDAAARATWRNVQNGKGCCPYCNRLDSIDPLATHCRYCGAKIG